MLASCRGSAATQRLPTRSCRLSRHSNGRCASVIPQFSISDVFPKRTAESPSTRPIFFAGFPAVFPSIAPFLSQYSTLLHGLVSFYPWPFYLLMALAPRAAVTRNLLYSTMSLVPLGLIYAVLLAASWTSDSMSKLLPGSLEAGLKSMAEGKPTMQFMPTLDSISELFSRPVASLSAWAHLQFVSFFLARWVWIDGVLKNVPIWHSVLLCGLLPPLGFLSHIITCFVYRSIHGDVESDADVAAAAAVAPPSPPMTSAAAARAGASSEASASSTEEPSTPSQFVAPATNGPTPPKGFPGSTFDDKPDSKATADTPGHPTEAGAEKQGDVGGTKVDVEPPAPPQTAEIVPSEKSSASEQSVASNKASAGSSATAIAEAFSTQKATSAAASDASHEQSSGKKKAPAENEQRLNAIGGSVQAKGAGGASTAALSESSESSESSEPQVKSHPVAVSVDQDDAQGALTGQADAAKVKAGFMNFISQNGRSSEGQSKNGRGHDIAAADWLTILPVTYVKRR